MHTVFSACRLFLLTGVLIAGSALSQAARAVGAPPITLQLNKLAPLPGADAGCRAYFVVANPGSEAISTLDLDLVMFGTDGIISGRVTLGIGPLPAGKTVVRLFDLAGTPCDSIGHILLNGVLACRWGNEAASDAGQEAGSCLERLAVSSLAKVPLTK